MKKTLLSLGGVGIVALGLSLLIGCNKGARNAGLRGTVVSAETNSFQEVTSRLDPGGNFFLYLSTEQMLRGVSGKIAHWRQFFENLPNVKGPEREQIGRGFDLATSLVQESGLEDVSGVGMSSIAIEPGVYRSKLFIHHYPNQGNGFLWKMFGQKPHPLQALDLLSTNTAVAIFSDVDVPMLWSEIHKQVTRAGIPQAEQALNKLPTEFQRATGLEWEHVLASLGGQFGVVLTLDESKQIPVPVPGSQGLKIPEPGLMIVAKVKDDTIFNRIDQELQKHKEQVTSVDKDGLKMRTLALPLPLPIQLRPTIATGDGYLYVATSDAMILDALAVKSGKEPGLKSTTEFKRLAKGIPEQGNEFCFMSQRFGQVLMKAQREFLAKSNKTPPAQKRWLESLLKPEKAGFTYSVAANTDQGWMFVGNGKK